MYIHLYAHWLDRSRRPAHRAPPRVLCRRVAPPDAGPARAAAMGATHPRTLRHGGRDAPPLHHHGTGTGARAITHAPHPARHVSARRASPRETVSRVRARLSGARILGYS